MKRILSMVLVLVMLLANFAVAEAAPTAPSFAAFVEGYLDFEEKEEGDWGNGWTFTGSEVEISTASQAFIELLTTDYSFKEICHFCLDYGYDYYVYAFKSADSYSGSFKLSNSSRGWSISNCHVTITYSQGRDDVDRVEFCVEGGFEVFDCGKKMNSSYIAVDDDPAPAATAKPTSKPSTPSNSNTTRTCSSCNGRGRIEKRCSSCGGDGEKDCMSCSGKGYDNCSGCYGSGDRRCGSCYGTGKNGSKRCTTCGGDGEKTCSSCNGRGRKDCSACRGTGDRDCSSCSGRGSKEESCSRCGGDGRVS